MKEIYVFSGLGVDERVFANITFSNSKVNFIKWIKPEPGESIEHYANRLTHQIKANKPILVGLSLGGMMAIEVSKIIETEKVILIASAKTATELPWYYKLIGKIKLHKVIPASLLKKPNFISHWLFGTVKGDQQLLKEILKDTDSVFLNWATDKIASWKNLQIPENLIHIHGTADRILPIKFIQAVHIIQSGGHFMTVNKSGEINQLLKKLI